MLKKWKIYVNASKMMGFFKLFFRNPPINHLLFDRSIDTQIDWKKQIYIDMNNQKNVWTRWETQIDR